MKLLPVKLLILIVLCMCSCNPNEDKTDPFNSDGMIIRISEIEIHPNYLDEYLKILKEESEASVGLESGVISIFPMFQKEHPNQIRILEIYRNKGAYESHLQTPHFKHYKTTTQKMVKSLELVDMVAIDEETIPQIFKKIEDTL